MRLRIGQWVLLLVVAWGSASCSGPAAAPSTSTSQPQVADESTAVLTPTAVERGPTSSPGPSTGSNYQDDYGPVFDSPPDTAPAPESASVALAETSLGTVLANSAGFTLYALTDDSPSQSRCTGGCAGVWPPLVVQGVPSGGPGIDPSKLSTLTRADGTLQVVYNGHPLYGYASDRAPGDIRGHGAGGVWFALDAGGELVP